MARFLVRRIFEGLIVLWLVTVGVFIIFYIGPGPKGVARALAGKSATPQVVAAVSHRLLLDRPIWVQYGHFLWLLLHGNLGYSFYHDQSVNSILAAAFPITLSLVLGAAILWIVIGVLSGVLSAVRARSFADRAFTGLALFFYSMPTFVLGLLFLLVLLLRVHDPRPCPLPRVRLHVVHHEPVRVVPRADPALVHPRAGVGRHLHPADPGVDAGRDGGGLHPHRPGQGPVRAAGHLPALAARGADADRHPVRPRRRASCSAARSSPSRSSRCRASGSPPCRPITQQDLPVIIGVVIVAAVAVVVANIVVDAFYAVLDPRVRLH